MNTVYDNAVLETKMTELLDSHLEVRSLMTVDDSLTEGVGMKKLINRYTYTGQVERLDQGAANSKAAAGSIHFEPEEYEVCRYQQTFRYNDMEAMRDPALVDMALKGAAEVMENQLRFDYFTQLRFIKHRHKISGDTLSYTDIVEALGDIDREVEDGLFILMGSDGRTAIRSDKDFIAARQGEILYTGQFGTLCGIPVLFSRYVPKGQVIITEREAVKFFVKREATIEQSRDIETKDNTVVYERHGLVALVDDTSSTILGKGAPELEITKSVSGMTVTFTVPDKGAQTNTYRINYNADAPLLGENLLHWEPWSGAGIVPTAGAVSYTIAEVDAAGRCVKSGTVAL